MHFRDKKIADDVNVAVVARGTPGMSGADLANLVNEAALFAVRRGETAVHREDFEDARDRVLMGLKRPTVVMNEEEKEHTAYHEGGHAVAAYVLEHADPVHKVTILPTGMALGMTQQLPEEEKYSHDKDFLDDMLSVLLGGRVAEQLIFQSQSTGAQNDLVRGTEIARRMVREWGMSDRIGPMAWGSQGAVFLGEDLVHTRDYSDETARVIDEEVERILRSQEERTLNMLTQYRPGLEAVAKALLEHETLDGLEVERLVDDAMGYRAGGPRKVVLADGTVENGRRRRPGDRRGRPARPAHLADRHRLGRGLVGADVGDGGPEVRRAHRTDERLAHHAFRIGDDDHGHAGDPVALVELAATRRTPCRRPRPRTTRARAPSRAIAAQESHVRDENSTTSHGDSGCGKSTR